MYRQRNGQELEQCILDIAISLASASGRVSLRRFCHPGRALLDLYKRETTHMERHPYNYQLKILSKTFVWPTLSSAVIKPANIYTRKSQKSFQISFCEFQHIQYITNGILLYYIRLRKVVAVVI